MRAAEPAWDPGLSQLSRARATPEAGYRSPDQQSSDGVFIKEQPGFRHPDRHDGKHWHLLANPCNTAEDFVAARVFGFCPSGLSAHDDEVEILVEPKDRGESTGHISSERRVEPPQIGSDHVQFVSMALGDAGDVATHWLVGRAVRQEECAERHSSVKEI